MGASGEAAATKLPVCAADSWLQGYEQERERDRERDRDRGRDADRDRERYRDRGEDGDRERHRDDRYVAVSLQTTLYHYIQD